jgi:hypothetical protein
MRKRIPRDPIRAYVREQIDTRRTLEGKQCECGENRPKALVRGSKPTICAEYEREQLGQSTLDQHHPAGEANDPTTIAIPVNDHRARLNVDQYDWPKTTTENPAGSPLVAAAARYRGYIDTNSYLQEKLLLENAEFLEALDAHLTEKLGPRWWENTRLERFSPKRKHSGGT